MAVMAPGPHLHQPVINCTEMPSPSAPIVNGQHHSVQIMG